MTTEDDHFGSGKKRKRKKRWFILRGRAERGPYTREELREAFVIGTLTIATRLRQEGHDEVLALSEVLGMGETYEGPVADPDDDDEDDEDDRAAPRARPAKRRSSSGRADPENPYAPPTEDEDRAPVESWREGPAPGSFGLGLAIGFLCGLFGLIYSFWAEGETKRGIRIGFAVQLVLGVVLQLAAMSSR